MEQFYKDSHEHIHDELLLVDLMINALVIKYKALKHSNNIMPGLYITGEEVEALLKKDPGYDKWVDVTGEVNEEYEKLVEMIRNLNEQIKIKLAASQKQGIFLKLEELSRIYNLSSLEVQILLLCLAPEFDNKYGTLFAYLQNDVTKKASGVEIILDLLCGTFRKKNWARRFFTAQSSLFVNNLIEFIPTPAEPARPLIARQLKANDRIVNYLLDDDRVDDELFQMVNFHLEGPDLENLALPGDIVSRFRDFINYYDHGGSRNFILALFGAYGTRKTDVAAAICREMGVPLLVADIQAIYQSDIYFERAIDLLLRESHIRSGALFLKNSEFLFQEDFSESHFRRYFINQLDRRSLLSFISSRELLPLYGEFSHQEMIAIELPLPDYKARKELWLSHLKPYNIHENVDVKEIAGKYSLSADQISDIVSTISVYSLWRSPDNPIITKADIEEATHIHSAQRLGPLAQRIRPKHRWNDIILKDEIKSRLHELVKMFRYKHIVYNEWEFDKKLSLGKGISALFFGEPGTGKTLAAEIIAAELGMDLYKIDISSIISKYIGETEKNLSCIFNEAENAHAILFFDEADAIFGKRTEVKDSHDRYSNIEVSYLLQRIGEYNGVVIMATNYLQNIDEAFERRLHFSINFPMPDEKSRLQIWQQIFPTAAPLAGIDFPLLASKLEISGGHIKNIALQAAFYAAGRERSSAGGVMEPKITMELVIKASKEEYKKMGRLWDDDLLS